MGINKLQSLNDDNNNKQQQNLIEQCNVFVIKVQTLNNDAQEQQRQQRLQFDFIEGGVVRMDGFLHHNLLLIVPSFP